MTTDSELKVDLYFSFRSPYSYLILPRMLNLRDQYGVNVNFKLVYPLAIREPEFFKGKNLFTFFFFVSVDLKSKARKLGMKFASPRPDPINQNMLTGKISDNQPYIFKICHLCQAIDKDKRLDFALKVSDLIFGGVKDWNKDEQLLKVTNKLDIDLHESKKYSTENEEEIIKEIKKNQEEQLLLGHHGVPLTVFKDKCFFGQDKFDELVEELEKHGFK